MWLITLVFQVLLVQRERFSTLNYYQFPSLNIKHRRRIFFYWHWFCIFYLLLFSLLLCGTGLYYSFQSASVMVPKDLQNLRSSLLCRYSKEFDIKHFLIVALFFPRFHYPALSGLSSYFLVLVLCCFWYSGTLLLLSFILWLLSLILTS